MADTQPAKKAAAKKAATPEPEETQDTWAQLTAPFSSAWVEKLPRNVKKNDDNRGRCEDTPAGRYYSADGHYCGGWHSRSVHLDYVGHAGITMRLNDVLGPGGWDFQPMAYTPEGLPMMSRDAFWGKLTVVVDGEEVTKWELAANFNGPQEALGDALRRCAMRLGIGTYLWAKSEHAAELASFQEPVAPPAQPEAGRQGPPQAEDTTPVHVQQTYDIVGSLSEDQKVKLAAWWDQMRDQGNLPPREHMATITPEQAALVEDAVVAIVETTTNATQAAQGPQ